MLTIKIDAPRAFTELELQILAASFEKMSQLATMYEDSGIKEPMHKYVSIKKEDIDISDVIDDNGTPKIWAPEITASDFMNALHLALHTMVSFTVDTKFGKKTTTSSLFPCLLSYAGYAAWHSEPDFIIRLDEQNRIQFECFGELAELINLGVDDDVTTTMIVEDNEVWSM